MALTYKADWEETKQRFLQWWRGEYFGRCALAVTAPRKDAPELPAPPPATDVHEQWYDLDRISQRNAYWLSRTWFGGEAVPVWNGGYPGHTSIPTFLGCPCKLDMNTGWWDPVLTDPERLDARHLRINEQHPDYQFTMRLLRRAAAESVGRCIPTIGAFGGCGDTLAALRGTQQLLFDCAERPQAVRDTEEYLMDMWMDFYNRCYAIIHEAAQGSTCWFTLWSPGKFYATQNDFSYCIGPRMFREVFLPVIRRQTEFLDHSVYHVDGVEAFRHVDALCELPRLQALQILPGAGKPSPLHYLDTLQKVQAAGKNLWICIAPEEVPTALEVLSARGLFIHTWAASEDDGRRLLENAERWSKVR